MGWCGVINSISKFHWLMPSCREDRELITKKSCNYCLMKFFKKGPCSWICMWLWKSRLAKCSYSVWGKRKKFRLRFGLNAFLGNWKKFDSPRTTVTTRQSLFFASKWLAYTSSQKQKSIRILSVLAQQCVIFPTATRESFLKNGSVTSLKRGFILVHGQFQVGANITRKSAQIMTLRDGIRDWMCILATDVAMDCRCICL